MSASIPRGRRTRPDSLQASSAPSGWAARVLRGQLVESNIADAVDDEAVLTALPPINVDAPGFRLPDALGLNMCSVDSTSTCPSTNWCSSTTACPSTTNCKSVQTCKRRDPAATAEDRLGSPLRAARIWPVAVS